MSGRNRIRLGTASMILIIPVLVALDRLEPFASQYDGPYAQRFAQLDLTTPHEAATLVNDIPVPELKPGERVAIGAKIQFARIRAGGIASLYVKLRIAPGHYVYAVQKSLNSSIPTRVEVTLPEGVTLEDAWSPPVPDKLDGALIYRKEAVFLNQLVLRKDLKPGNYKVEIKVSFQACNEAVCWPPQFLVTVVEFEVVDNAMNSAEEK